MNLSVIRIEQMFMDICQLLKYLDFYIQSVIFYVNIIVLSYYVLCR